MRITTAYLYPEARRLGAIALCAGLTLIAACEGGRESPNAARSSSTMSPDDRSSHPLLSGKRGGNAWANFCSDQPDSAPLPRDPRELIVPGVNEGKAVAFNAYWRSCDNAVARPTTCGELRDQSTLGRFVAMGQGEVGSPTTFAGGQAVPGGLSAENYNNLWQVWGLPGRPEKFDQLVAERHGSPEFPGRNPYPLPGEDPNQSDGGSGLGVLEAALDIGRPMFGE